MRLQKYKENQQQIRQFLDKQVVDKEQRKVFEVELNNRQAEFWKKDTNDYLDKEKAKNDYIKDVNLRHADILKQ